MRALLFSAGFLMISNLGASADVLRVECNPQGKPVSRLIEIDTATKQVRVWAKMPTVTNGPFGPYDADISPEKIVWMDVHKVGKTVGTTRYVMDRIQKTMTMDTTYNFDQDPWHETAPCK